LQSSALFLHTTVKFCTREGGQRHRTRRHPRTRHTESVGSARRQGQRAGTDAKKPDEHQTPPARPSVSGGYGDDSSFSGFARWLFRARFGGRFPRRRYFFLFWTANITFAWRSRGTSGPI